MSCLASRPKQTALRLTGVDHIARENRKYQRARFGRWDKLAWSGTIEQNRRMERVADRVRRYEDIAALNG
jgi:hypothetical protein